MKNHGKNCMFIGYTKIPFGRFALKLRVNIRWVEFMQIFLVGNCCFGILTGGIGDSLIELFVSSSY